MLPEAGRKKKVARTFLVAILFDVNADEWRQRRSDPVRRRRRRRVARRGSVNTAIRKTH